MGGIVRRAAEDPVVAQVVPDVLRIDAEHEANCRDAIAQARLLTSDDEREPPVLLPSEKLQQMVQKSGWPPRYRALLWAMSGNEARRAAEANGSTYAQLISHRRPPNASTCMSEIDRDLGA
jgi:hypothetical protein